MHRVRSEWALALVLPNVCLSEPIEGIEVALVPRHDQRILAFEAAHAHVRSFLNQFTDNFRFKFEPAALLVREDAPRTVYATEALAGFRDLVAMSVIPQNRAWDLRHGQKNRILWSDAFSFYPWTLDRDHKYLVAQTPALLGLHVVKKFQGQSAPELPSQLSINPAFVDDPLLGSLIKAWRRRYLTSVPQPGDSKLFRSLNMANQAHEYPPQGIRRSTMSAGLLRFGSVP